MRDIKRFQLQRDQTMKAIFALRRLISIAKPDETKADYEEQIKEIVAIATRDVSCMIPAEAYECPFTSKEERLSWEATHRQQ
jgi:hypothetical protein